MRLTYCGEHRKWTAPGQRKQECYREGIINQALLLLPYEHLPDKRISSLIGGLSRPKYSFCNSTSDHEIDTCGLPGKRDAT